MPPELCPDVEMYPKESPQQAPKHWLLRLVNIIVPRGGALSGMLNLASVTLGAGIISIPSAFNTSGMVMAMVYLLAVTALTVFSIHLLVAASERTGYRSFESLARGLLGRGADIAVALLMWLLCFGGATGYMVAVGDVLRPILAHKGVPEYLKTDSVRRLIMSCIWILFIFPFVLPKQVNSLRYVSAVGVLFIIFFVGCVVVHSVQKIAADGHLRSDLVLFRPGNSAVSGLALFMFAYLCQVNCFIIYYEMRCRSVANMTRDAAASCGICCLLYFLIGFFGYAEFGPEVSGSILAHFNPYTAPAFLVCFIGIIVKLCAAFSLNILACRTALFQTMQWDVDTMPYWKHSIFSVTFAVGALLFGLFLPDVDIVFGLVGAFCGGFIGFIFPALFIMYSGNWSYKSVGAVQYFLTYFILVAGVVAIVFGTGSTVYSTIKRFS
ncbi:putative amino acid transporter [Trypanosoma rangeli]|uniref:Putative amino acid transporter n=1 Tax=Trypanosoma rangeli TaxID=5698 RepID=A0A3R7N2A2_TRYRA|nr:putative amino acid transporter [Trypanosoma rangeli]RNE95191.1 putative amino acid transporter [Trypanosoma rangeli]|eukprot:RNE95191.1 putative amino acid transporter [Trypanosoma rangeli]